jgi:hypothetical protein
MKRYLACPATSCSKSVQRRKLIVKTAAVLLICLELGQFFSQGADPPPFLYAKEGR